MGRIEDQVTARTKGLIGCLIWYVNSMNKLQASFIRETNELNDAFNHEWKEYVEPRKGKNAKKSKRSVL